MLDVTNASATYRLKCMGTHHCLQGVVVKVLPFYPVSIALVFLLSASYFDYKQWSLCSGCTMANTFVYML